MKDLQKNARHAILFETMPIGVVQHEPDGTISYANAAAFRRLPEVRGPHPAAEGREGASRKRGAVPPALPVRRRRHGPS